MSEVNRYPLARERTARSRDLRNARNREAAVNKVFTASIVSEIGIIASIRDKEVRANGISAQKVKNNEITTANARRGAPRVASAVTTNAFDPVGTLRSFTSLFR